MKDEIHLVGSGQIPVVISPCESFTESHRVSMAAFEAGPMSRRKRRRLVEEEEFGIALSEDLPMATSELELAADPSPRHVTALSKRMRLRIMEATTPVAEHRAALRYRDNLAEGRHSVLQRHSSACSECRLTPQKIFRLTTP
ncbi:MAG: hypothetical protein JO188_11770 [Hyphomicrobiales bacterium]|nr:hypothetical protein [Hyphomicrobiales bacterium]